MPKLKSATILQADYDPQSQTLTVTFPNGKSYTHEDVPIEVYQGLLEAASAGSFYNREIKGVFG
jgi:hypothetical protein